MNNTSDKMSGKVKQTVGNMTDNKGLEAKGAFQQYKGKIKSNLKHNADKMNSRMNKKIDL